MASQVEIVNIAMIHLGMNAITNIAETGNPSAEAANALWVTCRDEVLSENRWPFANTQGALATVSDEILGWEFCYGYPSQAARVFYVYNEGTFDLKEQQAFEVVYIPSSNKRVICSNLELAYGEYTYKVSDTTLWDPKFVMAFSYNLASKLAHTLVDRETGLKMAQVYQALISDAKMLSYQEKIKVPSQNSETANSRA